MYFCVYVCGVCGGKKSNLKSPGFAHGSVGHHSYFTCWTMKVASLLLTMYKPCSILMTKKESHHFSRHMNWHVSLWCKLISVNCVKSVNCDEQRMRLKTATYKGLQNTAVWPVRSWPPRPRFWPYIGRLPGLSPWCPGSSVSRLPAGSDDCHHACSGRCCQGAQGHTSLTNTNQWMYTAHTVNNPLCIHFNTWEHKYK